MPEALVIAEGVISILPSVISVLTSILGEAHPDIVAALNAAESLAGALSSAKAAAPAS